MLYILVIEDDFKAFETYKRALINLGVSQLDYAASAGEAFSYLEKTQYDLLLLDIELPDMNGIEFAKKIRKDAKHHLVPLVFITGSEVDWELLAFRELHGYDYIRKPVTAKGLEKKLRQLVESLEAKKQSQPQPEPGKSERRLAIFFSQMGEETYVVVDEVLYAEAISGYCLLHTATGDLPLPGISLKEALVSLAAQKDTFVQCHRAFAVDASKIERIKKIDYRRFDVFLKGQKQPVSMSRQYKNAVECIWKGGYTK